MTAHVFDEIIFEPHEFEDPCSRKCTTCGGEFIALQRNATYCLNCLKQRSRAQEKETRKRRFPPFLGIDGEGGGIDHLGRQHYLLMIAENSDTHMKKDNGGKPLTAEDCFDFILSLPRNAILVGYVINYDAMQILRLLPSMVQQRILKAKVRQPVAFKDYMISYQHGQYLSVGLVDRRDGNARKGVSPKTLPGSKRTINETFGFFQSSFVKTIDNWGIGTERDRDIIRANKAARNTFIRLTNDIIDYCRLECRHLSLLMEAFREACYHSDIRPRDWRGAGHLASALLKKHEIPKRPLGKIEAQERAARDSKIAEQRKAAGKPPPKASTELRRPERPVALEIALNASYYGGRFEVSRLGMMPHPVHEYDINSAYPAAMARLPCPMHTTWIHKPRATGLPKDELYVAKITFSHPQTNHWCGFPMREKGGIYFPYQGTGWYLSPEIEAAQNYVDARIMTVHDVWIAQRNCGCDAYDWIPTLYQDRKTLGKGTRGIPIKLGMNSLYGKSAQRVGDAPWHDALTASIITARIRAMLLQAVGLNPESVVMLATDAVYSTAPLDLDCGSGLGQWEQTVRPDLFIVQPGVYWFPSDMTASGETRGVKSRGVTRSIIGGAAPRFKNNWNDFHSLLDDPDKRNLLLKERAIPFVPVDINVFIGCRLATARGKPYTAGKWEKVKRKTGFEWGSKRNPIRITVNPDGNITTYPISQFELTESEGYQVMNFDARFSEGKHRFSATFEDGDEIVDCSEDMLLEGVQDYTPFLEHEE
jgi:hypothetical protein